MTRPINRRVFLSSLLSTAAAAALALSGCAPAPTHTPTSTRIIPSAAAPTLTTTTTISPTPSSIPPTPTPAASATPIPAPLSQTGPWLMVSWESQYSGPKAYIDPIMLLNTDGSAWERLALPPSTADDGPRWWMGPIQPKGGILALQSYSNEYYPFCVKNQTPVGPDSALLYFLKLPENKIIRTFQLLGQQAQDQIGRENCELEANNPDGGEVPPVYAVTYAYGAPEWSPDGRYLAFSAAPDTAGADVYLYDRQTDSIRRLTDRQNNPLVLGWSPDGQWIVYRDVIRMGWFHSTVFESTGLYGVSLAGTERFLYRSPDRTIIPTAPGWISNDQFIIQADSCVLIKGENEACSPMKLILINISTGTHEVIFSSEKLSFGFATDPSAQILLMNSPSAGLRAGIYQFDLRERLISLVLEGEYGGLGFDRTRKEFYMSRADENNRRLITRIQYLPGDRVEIEKDLEPNFLSPNNQWSLEQREDGWYILDRQGHPIQKTVGGYCDWSPDSSSLACFDMASDPPYTKLFIYQKETGWIPQMIRQLDYTIPLAQWINP
jgi:hypothetical protein